MNKVTGGEIPTAIWKRFMTSAEKGKPVLDFAWLQPEPDEPSPDKPETDVTDDPAYLDEPSSGDEGRSTTPKSSRGAQAPPATDPDEDMRERALDGARPYTGSPASDGEPRAPLPSAPPPF
jgi:membrane peptidoglycan carboxypeptidase